MGRIHGQLELRSTRLLDGNKMPPKLESEVDGEGSIPIEIGRRISFDQRAELGTAKVIPIQMMSKIKSICVR